jgi:hypothetical protein
MELGTRVYVPEKGYGVVVRHGVLITAGDWLGEVVRGDDAEVISTPWYYKR